MTDRELVLELCKRLSLTKIDAKSDDDYDNKQTYIETPERITLGAGNGYKGFECWFDFDGDKLTGHSILE